MKLGHVDSLNYYKQDHVSAFKLVNVVPPQGTSGSGGAVDDPGEEGMMRFNSIRRVFEGYINGEWSELVTDAALFGGKPPSGTGNVTKEALKNILSQLFKTSDGTIHVIHGSGAKSIGDGYDIVAGEIKPLPDHITVPALAGNTIQPTGIWPEGGNNFVVCKNTSPTRAINGAVSIDFPKMFKMAKGPTATGSGGSGGKFIVGTLEGKIRKVAILDAGTGYAVGDAVVIIPGEKWDENANQYVSSGGGAVVSVATTDTGGEILTLSIDNPGKDYTPEEKFNYIFDVVSGLAGNSDATGDTRSPSNTFFSSHAVPAWVTSPDLTLQNNIDGRYGQYMFNMESMANQTGGGGFITTCKFIVTLYKYKEFSNLV
jgi:hypothetical protein